ncbi:MAG TPA: hypothetical protein VKB79_02030 [Bryobacteraceae bacterium]|nr:hypothetical protein [Bryobacteraceae bacterium]
MSLVWAFPYSSWRIKLTYPSGKSGLPTLLLHSGHGVAAPPQLQAIGLSLAPPLGRSG